VLPPWQLVQLAAKMAPTELFQVGEVCADAATPKITAPAANAP
jgi:hypothetical protein